MNPLIYKWLLMSSQRRKIVDHTVVTRVTHSQVRGDKTTLADDLVNKGDNLFHRIPPRPLTLPKTRLGRDTSGPLVLESASWVTYWNFPVPRSLVGKRTGRNVNKNRSDCQEPTRSSDPRHSAYVWSVVSADHDLGFSKERRVVVYPGAGET